jgi:AcrR family transcriptional regulator
LESRDLRSEILETAKQLFVERGYHGLAMRQIAEALHVSKAALYYHFKDKEELLLAILEAYLGDIELVIELAAETPGTCRERIRKLVAEILAQPAEQRAVMRLASQEMAQLSQPLRLAFSQTYHTRFLGKIQAILEAGIRSGELRQMDPGVATWVLLGMMYPYFYPAHYGDVPPPAQVVDNIATIYLDGIAIDQVR